MTQIAHMQTHTVINQPGSMIYRIIISGYSLTPVSPAWRISWIPSQHLCVLSLFHTASFIWKPAGLAAPQLPCKSGGVSMQWPADEVMVKNDLSPMRNVVILQRIHYKWQTSSPFRLFLSVQTLYHCWGLSVSTWSTCFIRWATREPQLKHNNTEPLF